MLEPRVGEAASRTAEDAEAWAWVDGVVEGDRLAAEVEQPLADPRLEEVLRLVRAELPSTSVQAVREYLRMLDDRREESRRLAVRSLTERLPDPKPASLVRRLGPAPDTLAAEILDLLRHERR